MTYRGRIKDGVVVLDDPSGLPEGTEVDVSPRPGEPDEGRDVETDMPTTLHERMKPYIGIVKDLPPDASANVDHYLYGAPKQG